MRCLLALLLCLNALPANAHDVDCSDPGNLPQQGMNHCAAFAFDEADRALNTLWPKVRDFAKSQDANYKGNQANLQGAEAALLKAQRGWIDYRDGECESQGFQARGGSLESFLVSSCKAHMTKVRIVELLNLMEEY